MAETNSLSKVNETAEAIRNVYVRWFLGRPAPIVASPSSTEQVLDPFLS
jgi:hypothetical protein